LIAEALETVEPGGGQAAKRRLPTGGQQRDAQDLALLERPGMGDEHSPARALPAPGRDT